MTTFGRDTVCKPRSNGPAQPACHLSDASCRGPKCFRGRFSPSRVCGKSTTTLARGLWLRNFCPAYPRRSIQPIPRRAPGDTVALKVALEVPIRYFVTVAPLLHHPDRGKLNDNLRQGSARPRARAAAEFTVNNQEGERE